MWDEFSELKLPSMQRHIRSATLITVYKLLHDYLNLSTEEFFEARAAGYLREHTCNVSLPRFHLARRKTAFAERSARPWNRLPPNFPEAQTVPSFNDRLDANWCSIFLDIV